jgi:NAD(P)-dependent dehydrogenase (short-subunit alcohol dehydrogenase family)
LVYLWSLGCNDGTARELPADRETAALTLLQLAGVLADASAGQASLRIVVSDLYDVTGDERLETSAAALAGLSRVIPQEYPHIDCTVIDLDRHTIEDSLVAGQESMPRIVSELGFAAARESVAYRHGRRWTCGYEPCLLPPVERLPRRLRRGGVYWITGGLGEIGQAMARYLARRAEARLLLTTRTAMPPQDAWDRIVSQSAPGDVTARRINLVRQLRAQGTELIVAAADVCDESQMRSALALAEGRWGQVQGVIHAAGLIRGDAFQPLRDTGRSIVRRHLEAKVVGLEVLDRLLENRALDFCLLVSSLSSILGGLRYGAYAAANACLDAHAWQRQRASRTKWISVNWDSWLRADVEDALPKSADPSGLVMRAAEGIDVLARILDHDLGPQVVVSTGNLLARLDRWVKRETTDPPALSAPSQRAHRRTLHPRPDLRSEYRAPRTELEQRLVELWKELLGLAEVGTLDSFFELGGDSLLGLQVIERIGQDTGQQISPIAIYESPTIQQLAASLAGDGSAEQPSVAGQDRGERRRQLQDQRAGRHPGRSSEG